MTEDNSASLAATGLSPLRDEAGKPSSPEASIPSAGDGDMSWFLFAVGRRKTRGYSDVVILDYADGWASFDIEFYWEDTFDCSPPTHLPPGAYRWVGFTVGWWGEDDALNVSGGRFEPYTAQGIEAASADETHSGSAVGESPVPATQGGAQ